jgi:hypothetical protein
MSKIIRFITYPIRKVQYERRIAARIRRLDAASPSNFKHSPLRSFAQRERSLCAGR